MMASASAMTYTPSVNSGGNADTENTSVTITSENELLALDISTNGTSRSSNKRSFFDRAYLSFPNDAESPKKRRKQSTPVKITAGAADGEQPIEEGKLEQPNSSCSPVLDSSTPSPEVFTPPVKPITEEQAASSPTSGPIPPADLFKLDFGAPSWMSDIQSKAPEEWLSTPPLHNVPFSFPSLQSPGLPGQVPLMDQQSGLLMSRPMNQPRIRIFNPDAYCELCNKEFCNKYFLKTHKANKHGIYTDLPPNELNFPPRVSSDRIPTPPKLHETTTKLPILPASCDICLKKFSNKSFIKRHKIKVHGIVYDSDPENDSNTDQNISDSNSETQQVNTSPTSQGENASTVPECLKPFLDTELDSDNVQQYQRWSIAIHSPSTLNQQVREAIHRPRGVGIVNPEAFCEICCKEYCNKYFLRTHKLKRHGIAIPMDDPPKEGDTVQTSPLNLIKSEQNSNESDIMTCGICAVQVAQKYMKAHYEACHSGGRTGSPSSNNGSENASNDKADTESSVNEDLKKLQTMILQLNNLNVCQIVTCNVCCKDFENKFYLQAHMMSDHGQLYMKITDDKINIQPSTNMTSVTNVTNVTNVTPPPIKEPPKLEPSQTPLENSIQRVSQIPTPTNMDRRPSISMAPTNSYCEICNKELCNKYFMKTHMQRMHGIEIENGAQIGGVVCNICNKELCSKYFLRVHKHNTHGIVEDGGPMSTSIPQHSLSRQTNNEDSNQPLPVPNELPPSDISLKPSDMSDLNHRYFAHFTEVCPICSRRFRSTKWLKAHLVTDHGKLDQDTKWEEFDLIYNNQKHKEDVKPNNGSDNDEDNNQSKVGIQSLLSNIFGQDDFNSKKYYCTLCNFSTPVLAFLFVHERSHGTPTSKNICPICAQSYQTPELLQQHILAQHKPLLPALPNKSLPTEETPNSPVIKTETEEPDLRRLTPNGIAQNLLEISKQMQLPTTYALPHHMESELDLDGEKVDDKYMMQPFLIEEIKDDLIGQAVQLRLVPSLVFLPVREKVTSPLTTSIKLTPT